MRGEPPGYSGRQNFRREFRTDCRLCLACSVLTFVLLGFIQVQGKAVEGKVGPTQLWGVLYTAFAHYEHVDAVPIAALAVVFVAVPAVILGWVAQAIVVVIHPALTNRVGETRG